MMIYTVEYSLCSRILLVLELDTVIKKIGKIK